jgi:PAS domain S-box-containing protein
VLFLFQKGLLLLMEHLSSTLSAQDTPMSHTSTILIVDDEPIGRRILEVLLADQGYHLVTACSGTEALERAALITPDLVLLDIMMPNMDGFEVCQRLRADPLLADVPVVMVTALDDRESRLRGIEVGADDFITKPIDRVEVRKRVQTIMRLDRYRRLLNEREQRQQAEEEIRRRNRELTLLNQVITAAASTLDVYAILHIACETLAQAFELPRAIALLLDSEQQQATIVADYVLTHSVAAPLMVVVDPGTDLVRKQAFSMSGTPALHTLATHKTPVAIADIHSDPRLSALRDMLRARGIVSVLLVPILIRESVHGCIVLCTSQPRLFSDDERALAQSVAIAVGQAMERAQLYQQLQQHADRLEETVARRTHELESERDRTQAILEALGEAVVVTDSAGVVQYINPAAEELTGFVSAQVVGQPWHITQHDEQSADLYPRILRSVQAGKPWRGEIVQPHRDGTAYDTAMTVAPIFDPYQPDTLLGIVSVQRDITPVKKAERLKDEFVSNVSHELRTPLSIITLLSGNLDTLFDRLDATRRRKMIRDIREHAQILNDLISSVLEISRIDGRRISTSYEHINLAEIVRDEVDQQLVLAQGKGQTLRAQGAERLMAWANEGQVRQIVRNLLNNAIKYTDADGDIYCDCQEIRATCDERRAPEADRQPWALLAGDSATMWPGCADLPAGHWAGLRVVDTGIGISLDDLPHIFERFYRVETQGTIPGTGLGLSITQELVDLHGGQLSIASSPGVGTIVAIYLPLIEETTV